MKDFISQDYLDNLIHTEKQSSPEEVADILKKAEELKGISIEEAYTLMQAKDDKSVHAIYETARNIKDHIYGNRIVMFAPLYITNECSNVCDYCGFRADNADLHRKTLTMEQLREETEILEDLGHKRLLLVYGEHPKFKADWIAKTIEEVYSVKKGNGEIRRINVNFAPMEVEDFRLIKDTGIGTYQCFQETYHRKTYDKVHLKGMKKDYLYRLHALSRAQEAGIDDIATGVLFGLYDWRFEVLALLEHAQYLDKEFGVGPHTISFPRIEPALNAPLSEHPPYQVSDDDFRKVVSILRIAVPYTGLILTTRETPQLRHELLSLGVSQISAGSRTYPGAYHDEKYNKPDMQQFTIGDTRSLDEVLGDVASMGYIPSFCTSCYRKGRTGADFMDLAKPGHIHTYCHPNAILTFMEYLMDYASDKTKETGFKLIEQEIGKIENDVIRKQFNEKFEKTKNGQRDLYF